MNAAHGLRPPRPGEVPEVGTPAHAWWMEGAAAEDRARKDGRSKGGLEVRELVDSLAENWQHLDAAGVAAVTFDICVLADMPLRRRLRTALKVLRGRL